ncbi:MAG: type II secretion system protein, partial [Candidatus Saccharibacteria bacterium]
MSLLRIKKTESGFTLLEITIVMALVGILTVATLAGSGNATKNAAFIGDIRIIRANIRDSETKSYTVKTGNGCATTESGPGGGASVC